MRLPPAPAAGTWNSQTARVPLTVYKDIKARCLNLGTRGAKGKLTEASQASPWRPPAHCSFSKQVSQKTNPWEARWFTRCPSQGWPVPLPLQPRRHSTGQSPSGRCSVSLLISCPLALGNPPRCRWGRGLRSPASSKLPTFEGFGLC